jgi:hypothetical protein
LQSWKGCSRWRVEPWETEHWDMEVSSAFMQAKDDAVSEIEELWEVTVSVSCCSWWLICVETISVSWASWFSMDFMRVLAIVWMKAPSCNDSEKLNWTLENGTRITVLLNFNVNCFTPSTTPMED